MQLLQYVDDNFPMQVVELPMRRGVLLGLLFTNKEGLVGDVTTEGSSGCSNCETVEFKNLCGRSTAIGRIATLDFRRANFDFFKDLPGGLLWARVLEGKGAQHSRLVLKHHCFQAQDQCIPESKKLGQGGDRPAWVSKELMDKLKGKKVVHEMWEKALSTWEEYKNVVKA